MSEQVRFELNYKIDGKDTVCGFKQMDDDDGERYFLLCVTIGDYTREYELRSVHGAGECQYQFVTPDVPEGLKQHECDISNAILEHYPDNV